MPRQTFHFLNVKNGDCSIIEHGSGHVSVIDVCNARSDENVKAMSVEEIIDLVLGGQELAKATQARKNYGQKSNPVNPIQYLKSHGISTVFRFALTHPDMDHMDGIKDFFEEFPPINFWDTNNSKEMDSSGWEGSPYREEDWNFYKSLRDSRSATDPKRLTRYAGDDGQYWNRGEDGKLPGDAFHILAPTPELVTSANESAGDYHDASYVFIYYGHAGKVILSGDSHDATWEHILENHADDVKDAAILVAPHHGRKSSRSYDFLDVVNPRLTLFGNAPAKDLAYDAWRNRGLEYITNNQAGSVVVSTGTKPVKVYVTNETFARDRNPSTTYSNTYQAWFLKEIN